MVAGTRHVVALLRLALPLCLLLMAACGGSDGGKATPTLTPPSEAGPDSTPGLRILVLGETVSNDMAEMTVHGFEEPMEYGDFLAQARHRLVVLEMSVTSLSSEPFTLSADLVGLDGSYFEKLSGFDETIEPGESVRGEIVFEAPLDQAGTFLFGADGAQWAVQLGMFRHSPR